MKSLVYLLCVFLAVFILETHAHNATKKTILSLYEKLFDKSNYNKQIRPVNTSNITVTAEIVYELQSIIDLDEKEQTMTTSGTLEVTWHNDFLMWDKEEYEGTTQIFVSQESIWVPDLHVRNSIKTGKQLGHDDNIVMVTSDGYVVWTMGLVVTTTCDIDVTYYPFDTQRCSILLQTMTHIDKEVNISLSFFAHWQDEEFQAVQKTDYKADGSWRLVRTHGKTSKSGYDKAQVVYILLLERRSGFYVLNMVIPVLILTCTVSLVFHLPADAGEKMGFSITVLLAYAVYLNIVTEYLPATSLQTSVLALYLDLLLMVTVLTVIISGCILRHHYKSPDVKVGRKTKMMTRFLMTVTFYRPEDHGCVAEKDESIEEKPPAPNEKSPIVKKIIDKEAESIKITWQVVGKVLDYFCCIAFSFLVFIMSLVMYLVLVIGGAMNQERLADDILSGTIEELV